MRRSILNAPVLNVDNVNTATLSKIRSNNTVAQHVWWIYISLQYIYQTISSPGIHRSQRSYLQSQRRYIWYISHTIISTQIYINTLSPCVFPKHILQCNKYDHSEYPSTQNEYQFFSINNTTLNTTQKSSMQQIHNNLQRSLHAVFSIGIRAGYHPTQLPA